MRDVTSSSIVHEHTQSNRVCCFQTLDALLPNDTIFRLFRDLNSCRCIMWRPENVSPYIDIVLLSLCFLVLWDYEFNIKLETEYRSTVGLMEGCRIFQYLS